MKRYRLLLCAAILVLLAPVGMSAKPMKARTIQPLFAKDAKGLEQSFIWTLEELRKCDESLDIIVLPEFSEVPGSTPNSEFLNVVRKNGPSLLAECAATAKRCSALVFCGAIDMTEFGPRNTLFVYDREGNQVGGYLKEHLTRGEWANLGFDKSYTQEWNAPYMLEIEGVKYAFLTCYDFYFYENYSNIARFNPDVIIGSSHQRSDTHLALDIIDAFCAYNTGTYLVRASVSMGEDSPLGGCSCIVAPTGKILANLYSKVGTADVTFDPMEKYLKPAGYGNPPAKHCQYIEIGRRPWKYRPGGSAITLPIREAAEKRICALRGFSSIADESLLAAYGAAVAVGASEIGVSVTDAKALEEFSQVLKKLSCHTIMNVRVEGVKEDLLAALVAMVDDYDANDYVYFSSSNQKILAQLGTIAPAIPRCAVLNSTSLSEALRSGCSMIQIASADFNSDIAAAAHDKGLRCVVACPNDGRRAAILVEQGADTLLSDDYQMISKATGLK